MPEQPTEPQPNQDPAQQPASPPPTEPQPGEGGPPTPPARGLKGAGLRYTAEDGVEPWAVGKTADEVYEIAKTMYAAVLSGNPPQQPMQPQPAAYGYAPPQPAAPAVPNGTPQPPNADLMLSDPAEYQRQWDAYNASRVQQTIQQVSGPYLQAQAAMARNAARSDPENADVWAAYGHEIDAEMAPGKVSLEMRANPEMWKMAAELVGGRHRKELARKEAERIAATVPDAGTLDGSGGAPVPASPASDPIAKLWRERPDIAEAYKRDGLPLEKVRAHALARGLNLEKFAESIRNRHVIHA